MTTKVTWVIDEVITSGRIETEKLPAVVRELGHNVYEAKYDWDRRTWGEFTLTPDVGPVVFYASHGFVAKHAGPFVPGSFGFVPRTRVTQYMDNLPREWFLNEDMMMTTWADFSRRPDFWYNYFRNNRLFVRPESGFKTFAGTTIQRDEHAFEINAMNQTTGVMPETVIHLASPKDTFMQGEFRFVVADGNVVAGSEYRWDGRLDIRRDWPELCHTMATMVAKHKWQVDRVYTVDVTLLHNGEARIVELNGFSSAGLYACDLHQVVEAVSQAAVDEWRDLHPEQ